MEILWKWFYNSKLSLSYYILEYTLIVYNMCISPGSWHKIERQSDQLLLWNFVEENHHIGSLIWALKETCPKWVDVLQSPRHRVARWRIYLCKKNWGKKSGRIHIFAKSSIVWVNLIWNSVFKSCSAFDPQK